MNCPTHNHQNESWNYFIPNETVDLQIMNILQRIRGWNGCAKKCIELGFEN